MHEIWYTVDRAFNGDTRMTSLSSSQQCAYLGVNQPFSKTSSSYSKRSEKKYVGTFTFVLRDMEAKIPDVLPEQISCGNYYL